MRAYALVTVESPVARVARVAVLDNGGRVRDNRSSNGRATVQDEGPKNVAAAPDERDAPRSHHACPT